MEQSCTEKSFAAGQHDALHAIAVRLLNGPDQGPAQLGIQRIDRWPGQADLADTVRAVNDASLDHYIAKPWDHDELLDVVTEQLTDYVEATGINPIPHMRVLDQVRAVELIRDYRAD